MKLAKLEINIPGSLIGVAIIKRRIKINQAHFHVLIYLYTYYITSVMRAFRVSLSKNRHVR